METCGRHLLLLKPSESSLRAVENPTMQSASCRLGPREFPLFPGMRVPQAASAPWQAGMHDTAHLKVVGSPTGTRPPLPIGIRTGLAAHPWERSGP